MERKQYEAMKKDELIDLLLKQVHLASAVQAKDKEISDLKTQQKVEVERLVKQEMEKSNKLLDEKTKELEKIKAEKEANKKAFDEYNQQTDKFIQSLSKTCQDVLDRYQSLLKIIQGASDSHVELHEFSNQIFKSHFPKNIK